MCMCVCICPSSTLLGSINATWTNRRLHTPAVSCGWTSTIVHSNDQPRTRSREELYVSRDGMSKVVHSAICTVIFQSQPVKRTLIVHPWKPTCSVVKRAVMSYSNSKGLLCEVASSLIWNPDNLAFTYTCASNNSQDYSFMFIFQNNIRSCGV